MSTTLFGHPLFSRLIFNPYFNFRAIQNLSYQPEFSAQVESAPRVLGASFGDGYEQRTGDGINNDLRKWNLMFMRETADIAVIEALFESCGGVSAFTWTPSGEDELTVVCRKWERVRIAPDAQGLSASFEEVLS